MHAVIVDGDISYPPTSGKRLRTLHLMLRLAKRHHVTYIGRGDARQPAFGQARQYLGDHGIETVLVDHPVPQKSGLAFACRLAANVLSALPYSVASHHSRAVRRAVENYAATHAVHIWQFEWLPYLAALRPTAAARRVVVAHNIDTLIWQRYRETAKGTLQKIFFKQQWRKMKRYERAHFPTATWVVAVSSADARWIRDDFGMPRVDVVDNGMDGAYFEPVTSCREANRILFLGALDWRPNLDAVDLLLERIFPLVRDQEPTARLCIVGRNPPARLVQRLDGMDGVELHADVPDVRPYLNRCGVMTVPLRIGGGTRLKILEALASSLPVVSTTVGAEGLNLEPGRDFARADTPEEMAQELVRAIRAPGPFRDMASKGRQIVLEQYDWDVLAGRLEQVWEKCLRVDPSPPARLPGGERGERADSLTPPSPLGRGVGG
jgi:glycosyltransferase involved in cell wall biosynthesis